MAEAKHGGWIKWFIVLVILGGGAAGGWFYTRRGHTDAPEYQTASVGRGELTQVVTATGVLNPVKNVQVGCQVSGRINVMYVDYNSQVKQGQVIAEIDPATYNAALQQAEADLANARANLELQAVQAKRASDLYDAKLISASDFDTATATLHEAQATVQIKQATLANATANLGYCKILSPVDGVVISRAVDVGQTVASSFSTPTLFQIANDLTKMQIDSSIAEADIGTITEGQTVDFTVDAYPYRTFHGAVVQVRNAPITVNNVVTYDTVIGVTNKDYKLKPGMTANVSIVIAQREDAVRIPNAALRFHPADSLLATTNAAAPAGTNSGVPRGGAGGMWGGHHRGGPSNVHTVYVLDGEQTLVPVQIKTGISDGIFTEVTEGLKEGDTLVTGVSSGDTQAAGSANPFGGGFGRMR